MHDGCDRTSDDRVERLRALDLFCSLAASMLERLASESVRLGFQRGAAILREGDEGAYVYVIAEGQVELFRGTRLVETLGPGELFGHVALLRSTVQPVSALARTAVILHALDGPTFLAAVSTGPRNAHAGAARRR